MTQWITRGELHAITPPAGAAATEPLAPTMGALDGINITVNPSAEGPANSAEIDQLLPMLVQKLTARQQRQAPW